MRLLTARLSARRRSRLAGPVVLLLGLLVTGGFYAALAPASAEDTAASTDAVEEGRALFLVGCSSCHGQNGEGIVTKDGNQYGPSLVGVGAAAVDFQVATGRMPMAAPGPQAPVKQPLYTEEETAALAAYVASPRPRPRHSGPGELRPGHHPRERARGGHRPGRRVLPHQLHGLPQLRR